MQSLPNPEASMGTLPGFWGIGERQARSSGGGGISYGGCRFFRHGGYTFIKVGAMPGDGKCKWPEPT